MSIANNIHFNHGDPKRRDMIVPTGNAVDCEMDMETLKDQMTVQTGLWKHATKDSDLDVNIGDVLVHFDFMTEGTEGVTVISTCHGLGDKSNDAHLKGKTMAQLEMSMAFIGTPEVSWKYSEGTNPKLTALRGGSATLKCFFDPPVVGAEYLVGLKPQKDEDSPCRIGLVKKDPKVHSANYRVLKKLAIKMLQGDFTMDQIQKSTHLTLAYRMYQLMAAQALHRASGIIIGAYNPNDFRVYHAMEHIFKAENGTVSLPRNDATFQGFRRNLVEVLRDNADFDLTTIPLSNDPDPNLQKETQILAQKEADLQTQNLNRANTITENVHKMVDSYNKQLFMAITDFNDMIKRQTVGICTHAFDNDEGIVNIFS